RLGHADAGLLVEIIAAVLAAVVDQQVFLLVDQIHDVPVADLEVGGHLDRQGRAGLGAEAAEDAAGEVDPEPFGKAPAVLPLAGLHGDAVHRTGGRAEIAGDAALFPFRVAGEDDPRPVAGKGGALLL